MTEGRVHIVHRYGDDKALCGWKLPHPHFEPLPLDRLPQLERCPACVSLLAGHTSLYALTPPEDWLKWEETK